MSVAYLSQDGCAVAVQQSTEVDLRLKMHDLLALKDLCL